MKVSECKNKIKVGDWVRTNGNDGGVMEKFVEGEIGEIQDDCFFVWQNKLDGVTGSIPPSTKGYKYSWRVSFNNPDAKIEIVKPAETQIVKPVKGGEKTTMKTLKTLAKKLLDRNTRLLMEMEYINGDLERTSKGTEALLDILFLERKEDLVKLAKKEKKELEKKEN